jgi:membrane protein implicated in regulation of membrane protease activity
MLQGLAAHIPLAWLALAVVLGVAELLIPGVFLVFLAIAAAIVAAATLVLPDLPLAAQIGAFGMWSVVTVMIGRRWYRDYPVETSDPLLNDRARRLVGETVIVAEPIVAGRGRVRVGDGEWPAAGPDASVGARMRIVSVTGGVVMVEPA